MNSSTTPEMSVPRMMGKAPCGCHSGRSALYPSRSTLLTAWQFMIELGHNEPNPLQPNKHKPVLEGKTVLVNGAAGGVGHCAVHVAKLKGAHVIVVASGEHESFLRELGADEFID